MSAPLVLFDPAAAIAAGRCLAARVRDRQRWTTAMHPTRCGWCDFPTAILDGMIRGFHAWSGWNERNRTYGHHELRVWAELGADQQAAQILAAQQLEAGLPPAPGAAPDQPIDPAPPTPADAQPPLADPPERPDWLGGPP
jgi:hypothetical protein